MKNEKNLAAIIAIMMMVSSVSMNVFAQDVADETPIDVQEATDEVISDSAVKILEEDIDYSKSYICEKGVSTNISEVSSDYSNLVFYFDTENVKKLAVGETFKASLKIKNNQDGLTAMLFQPKITNYDSNGNVTDTSVAQIIGFEEGDTSQFGLSSGKIMDEEDVKFDIDNGGNYFFDWVNNPIVGDGELFTVEFRKINDGYINFGAIITKDCIANSSYKEIANFAVSMNLINYSDSYIYNNGIVSNVEEFPDEFSALTFDVQTKKAKSLAIDDTFNVTINVKNNQNGLSSMLVKPKITYYDKDGNVTSTPCAEMVEVVEGNATAFGLKAGNLIDGDTVLADLKNQGNSMLDWVTNPLVGNGELLKIKFKKTGEGYIKVGLSLTPNDLANGGFNQINTFGVKLTLDSNVYTEQVAIKTEIAKSADGTLVVKVGKTDGELKEIKASDFKITDKNTIVMPVLSDFKSLTSGMLNGLDLTKLSAIDKTGKATYTLDDGTTITIQFARFGDVDSNGGIGASDYAQVKAKVRKIASALDTNEMGKVLGDVDADGKIAASDYAQIKARARGVKDDNFQADINIFGE